MPHIIIEYPSAAISDDQIDVIIKSVHGAVLDSGLFEAGHIKARAYGFHYFSNAGGDKPYIHTQARIKSGRSLEQKKKLSSAILKSISENELAIGVITVEVIDMDRGSYSKFSK